MIAVITFYCILHGQIKGFSCFITTILFEVDSGWDARIVIECTHFIKEFVDTLKYSPMKHLKALPLPLYEIYST